MSLEEGQEAKREGQARAASRCSDWIAAAKEVVLRLAEHGQEFSAETITNIVGEPESPGAVGTVFSHLARSKQIEWTGKIVQNTKTQAHASDLRVWRVYSGTQERNQRVLSLLADEMEIPEGSILTLAQRNPRRFARIISEAWHA